MSSFKTQSDSDRHYLKVSIEEEEEEGCSGNLGHLPGNCQGFRVIQDFVLCNLSFFFEKNF